jgi:hypothetical protein
MKLATQIESIRPIGRVICGIYHGQEVVDVKDKLKSLGLEKSGFGVCSEIEKNKAKELAVDALSNHLWTEESIMAKTEAERAVDSFFSALPEEYKLFTNYMWGGVEPISHSFIDQGLLAVANEKLVGILWVLDDEEP